MVGLHLRQRRRRVVGLHRLWWRRWGVRLGMVVFGRDVVEDRRALGHGDVGLGGWRVGGLLHRGQIGGGRGRWVESGGGQVLRSRSGVRVGHRLYRGMVRSGRGRTIVGLGCGAVRLRRGTVGGLRRGTVGGLRGGAVGFGRGTVKLGRGPVGLQIVRLGRRSVGLWPVVRWQRWPVVRPWPVGPPVHGRLLALSLGQLVGDGDGMLRGGGHRREAHDQEEEKILGKRNKHP